LQLPPGSYSLSILDRPEVGSSYHLEQTPSWLSNFSMALANPLPQGNNLRGASFLDANTGTVVGDYGTIVRTTMAEIVG